MDEDGKGPGLVENADRQSRPRLDASEAAADEFARDAAGQAIASSSADTARDEPGQVAPTPTRDAIPRRPLPEGTTPKTLPAPDASHALPRPTDLTDDTNEGAA